MRTGQLVDLVFSVPNEDDALPMDHVTLSAPMSFALDDAEAKPGWAQSHAGQVVTWSGGMIPRGEFARFSIRGTAPAQAKPVVFNVLVGDHTGASITYRVALDVAAHGPEDSGARSLGTAALIVALVAAAFALAAGFFALYLWLRPPPA